MMVAVCNLQVVIDHENFDAELLKSITTGAAVDVVGQLTESQRAGATRGGINLSSLHLYGKAGKYLPSSEKGHSMEFLREIDSSTSSHKYIWGYI